MRVGIVGTGSMGARHAAAWISTPATIGGFLKKTAVSTPLPQQYNCKLYSSFEEMLDEVDIVDICTPTHLHHEMVLHAAKANKHIICEKPFARTLIQAQEMIDVCKQFDVKICVAHVLRYFPIYAAAKQRTAIDAIGDLSLIRLNRHGTAPQFEGYNWFLDREKSGGMLLDLMIHDFDYARWLAGEVKSVTAFRLEPNQISDILEYAIVMLHHKNGAISQIEGSWSTLETPFRTSLEIGGTRGLLRFDSRASEEQQLFERTMGNETKPLPIGSHSHNPYVLQIQDFYHHIVRNTNTAVTAQDGLAALQIGLAAIESVQSGQTVLL